MNKTLTTFAAAGQFFTAPTDLDHLQGAYAEAIRQMAIAAIGATYDNSKCYILWGCNYNAISGIAASIDAGAIFYAGEVYFTPYSGVFDPTTFTPNAKINIAYPAADPQPFDDGSSHNIHQIRTIEWVHTGTTGAIQLYSAITRVLGPVENQVDTQPFTTYTATFDRNKFIVFTDATGPATIDVTFSLAKASQGAVVVLHFPSVSAGDVVNTPSAYYALDKTLPYTLDNSTSLTLRLTYVAGPNDVLVEVFNPAP